MDDPSASFETEAEDGDGLSPSPGGDMGPLSPPSSAEASLSTGALAEECHEVHLTSGSSRRRNTGGVGPGRSAGVGGSTSGRAGDGSLSRTGLQVRNLSTGDVDMVIPGCTGMDIGGVGAGQRRASVRGVAGARERASTEEDVLAGGSKVRLGRKIWGEKMPGAYFLETEHGGDRPLLAHVGA